MACLLVVMLRCMSHPLQLDECLNKNRSGVLQCYLQLKWVR